LAARRLCVGAGELIRPKRTTAFLIEAGKLGVQSVQLPRHKRRLHDADAIRATPTIKVGYGA
jgi:hypothetical protein